MISPDGTTLTAPAAQPTTTETTTTMNPTLLTTLINSIALAPTIVAGIEQIHKDASGATKLQLAKEALGLATGAASAILPADMGNIATEVGTATESIINSFVGAFNAVGLFTHKATA